MNYAWTARGSGWSNSVSSWNGFLYKKRLALSRRYLERAESLNPLDCRVYSALLGVGKGQNWTKEEMAKVFNKSVSIDPAYYPSYEEILETKMPKWFGSTEEMMAFAEKWQDRQPYLMVLALEEQAENQKGVKDLEHYRFLGSPRIWPQYFGAYQNFFKTISTDRYGDWVSFAYEAAKCDKVADFIAFLRAQAEGDEVVRNFSPYLVNLAYAYRADAIGWSHTGQLYLNTPAVWAEIFKSSLQIMKQDPDNYAFLNTQALTFTGWGRFKSARLVFDAIGGHWVAKAGTRENFEKFKRVARHQEAPSWHLCLSTAEQADEK
jgi:hypothetical protein